MWEEKNNFLIKEYKFKDFLEAFSFLSEVAKLSEKHNHHPTIVNTYNYVRLELNTHDRGGIVTEKDFALAKEIDQI